MSNCRIDSLDFLIVQFFSFAHRYRHRLNKQKRNESNISSYYLFITYSFRKHGMVVFIASDHQDIEKRPSNCRSKKIENMSRAGDAMKIIMSNRNGKNRNKQKIIIETSPFRGWSFFMFGSCFFFFLFSLKFSFRAPVVLC